MAAEREFRLGTSGPIVGSSLVFDGREWQVTRRSNYQDDAGDRVAEWCCEAKDTTGYLLRETDDKKQTRWFFTRQIDPEGVMLDSGQALPAWLQGSAAPEPPATLIYRGQAYRYAETSAGTHAEESGERLRKTTWEYWDEPRGHNLAVERWEGGGFDCYHGAYIETGAVLVRPGAARSRALAGRSANPFVFAIGALPVAYLLAFIVGRPFDQALAFALPAAAVAGWLCVLGRAPSPGLMALGLLLVLAFLFWHYPPLTSGLGIVAFFGAPAAVAMWARSRDAAGEAALVVYAAAFAVGLPLLVLGMIHYFRFAPGPHTLGQLMLALGPAVLGGLAACLIAAVVFRAASSPG